MSRTAYAVLKVPANATEAAIDRAYQLRLIEVQTNMKLSDADRQQEILAIEEANRVLSRATARELYDRKLAADLTSSDRAGSGGMRAGLAAAAIVMAIAAGGYFWVQQRDAALRQAEQEQILENQKAAAAQLAASERLKFEEQQRRDAAERRAAEEARLAEVREAREKEMQAEKFVALPQAAPAKTQAQINRENFLRQYGELVEQSEVEKQRRQAQQVADRQRRYVEQLSREENEAAQQRARAVEIENMRRRMEEQRNQGK